MAKKKDTPIDTVTAATAATDDSKPDTGRDGKQRPELEVPAESPHPAEEVRVPVQGAAAPEGLEQLPRRQSDPVATASDGRVRGADHLHVVEPHTEDPLATGSANVAPVVNNPEAAHATASQDERKRTDPALNGANDAPDGQPLTDPLTAQPHDGDGNLAPSFRASSKQTVITEGADAAESRKTAYPDVDAVRRVGGTSSLNAREIAEILRRQPPPLPESKDEAGAFADYPADEPPPYVEPEVLTLHKLIYDLERRGTYGHGMDEDRELERSGAKVLRRFLGLPDEGGVLYPAPAAALGPDRSDAPKHPRYKNQDDIAAKEKGKDGQAPQERPMTLADAVAVIRAHKAAADVTGKPEDGPSPETLALIEQDPLPFPGDEPPHTT